jgi:hypothetical protein
VLNEEKNAALDRAQVLAAALEQYGRHSWAICAKGTRQDSPEKHCTCGLAAALAAARRE